MLPLKGLNSKDVQAIPPSAGSSLRAPLQSEASQRSHRQPDLHCELHYRDIPAVPPSARSSPRAPLQRHLSGPTVSRIFTASSITETSQRSQRQPDLHRELHYRDISAVPLSANREQRTHDTVTKTIKKSERNKEANETKKRATKNGKKTENERKRKKQVQSKRS